VTVPQADVPVGGGTILEDDLIVVTQPAEGEFKAFTAVCTHQKCPVGEIADRQIICPCHQSHYSIEDGSVVSGPAPASLKEFPVTLKGDDVVIG
jgi:Rieske Fe-S protein